MPHVQRLDHVGIAVSDLERTTAFFVSLGLEIEGLSDISGDFVDTAIGIDGSHSRIAVLRPPDGGAGVELSSFITPDHQTGSPEAMAT